MALLTESSETGLPFENRRVKATTQSDQVISQRLVETLERMTDCI